MKKLLLTFFVTFLLTGCGIQTVEQYEQMQEEERSQEDVALKTEREQDEIQAPETYVKEEEKQEEPVEEQQDTEPNEQPENEVQQKPVQQMPPAAQKPVEQTKPVEQVKPVQTKPVEQPKQQVEQKPTVSKPVETPKRYATISIEVHSLLKHYDQLHPSLQSEQYVPSSGFILTPKKYELLTEKDTVWNVLQRAVKEHSIHLEYEGANENIYNNVYIEGINHLYEFSAGPLSGWMYSVNGTYPNYGSSQYVLNDGDVIEWHYTVDLGRDLGVDGR